MLSGKYIRVSCFLTGMMSMFFLISVWKILYNNRMMDIGSRRIRNYIKTSIQDQNDEFSINNSISKTTESNTTHQIPTLSTESIRTYQRSPTSATKSKQSSKPAEIDMGNGYHPFVDFSLHFPETMPTLQKSEGHFLIVLVNSAAKGDQHRRRRAIIRKTWGSHNTCEQRKMTANKDLSNLTWLLVFVLAKVGPETDDDELNKEEVKKYNDMLVGNFPDVYVNNVLKLYMAHLWAASLPNVKYTLKVDDDVYVRIPKVIEYLADAGFPERFYGGVTLHPTVVDRNPKGKWAVSWKYYPEKMFPHFNFGAFIILSRDVFPYLFNYVNIRKPFHTDDAYVGVAMRDAKVKATNIRSFVRHDIKISDMERRIRERSICGTLYLFGVSHNVEAYVCKILHDRIETMCVKNMTLSTACRNLRPPYFTKQL